MTQTLHGHSILVVISPPVDPGSVQKRTVVCGPLIGIFAATTIVHVPSAVADPACPAGGEQTAKVVIDDLEAQGYDVQINWLNGQSYRSLRVHGSGRP